MEKTCPQCLKTIDRNTRIFKDEVCGHSKCKQCLLQEEDECKQCSVQIEVIDDHNYSNEPSVAVGFEIVQVETFDGDKFEIIKDNYDETEDGKEQYIEEEYLETQSELDYGSKESTQIIKVQPKKTKAVPKHSVTKRDRSSSNIPSFVESITITNEDTGKEEHRYRCNICQKSFKSSHQIRYHKYCDETVEKPFKCDECSSKFRTSYQLKQHQQLHLDTYYECPECNKKFAHDASAKKHMKKHYQPQPTPPSRKKSNPNCSFSCAICQKVFSRMDYLKKHMICHETTKRFKCPYCERFYARNNALKFHLATSHMEKQEFPCHCGKIMTSVQSLARHQGTHSTAKPLKCKICGLKTSRKDNLFRHIRTFHPDCVPKENIEVEESPVTIIEDGEVPIEETEDETQIIRSQEKTLRRNVIVLKKAVVEEEEIESQKITNETPTIVYRMTNLKKEEDNTTKDQEVQNMKNIDIYRKILMPIEEDDQPEEEETQEYIEYLS